MRFDKAVKQEAERLLKKMQGDYSENLQKLMHESLGGIDHAKEALKVMEDKLHKEYEEARLLRKEAEEEGEKLVQAYFEQRREGLLEFAKNEWLRQLIRSHLEAGRTKEDICKWLQVDQKFVEDIETILFRLKKIYPSHEFEIQQTIGPGARLRYSSEGRGGTIWFENDQTQFDMWWEFGGGDALVIIDVPSPEQWERLTKIPIGKRDEVLEFIARSVVADKTHGACTYLIGQKVITIYK